MAPAAADAGPLDRRRHPMREHPVGEKPPEPRPESIPEGWAFLRRIQTVAEMCAKHTDHRLPEMGKAAPQIMEHLGTVLALLYQMGTCSWGCAGGDHVVQHTVARSCSTASAALSLMRSGYYDEALALARNIGEAANLLTLCSRDAQAFEAWRSSTEQVRKTKFSPVKVRLALEKLGLHDLGLIGEDRYRQLSRLGTHISPDVKSQVYNPLGLPTLGAVFQDIGVLLTLNEIAIAVGFLAPPASKLLAVPTVRWQHIKASVVDLLSSVGGIHATDLDDVMRLIRKSGDSATRQA